MPVSLKERLTQLTADQRKALAKAAKLSIQSLSHIAFGHRRGSALTAIRLVKADPQVSMTSVCPACRECPHYQNRDA